MTVIDWLLKQDVFIQYLVQKDLLQASDEVLQPLQERILQEGVGALLLSKQDPSTDLWGEGLYSPKYISTHYTLLQFCRIGADLNHPCFHKALEKLVAGMWKKGGEVNRYRHQDVCVVAMMVRIATQAQWQDERLHEMMDYLFSTKMKDGGWNCSYERTPLPKQSSLHTTLSVLEAFANYQNYGYVYRLNEIQESIPSAVAYLQSKELFLSKTTKQVIHRDMLSFPFPYGWKYDILRALTVMVDLKITDDASFEKAYQHVIQRLDRYGRLTADARPPSLQHFRYTKTKQPYPYNTYRALKVVSYVDPTFYQKLVQQKIE